MKALSYFCVLTCSVLFMSFSGKDKYFEGVIVYEIKYESSNPNLKPEDLHVNPSGAVCLCIKPEEAENLPAGFNIADFLNNLVIPFFYAQSHFEQYNSWPWGQYSHGNLGFIEWYLRQKGSTHQAMSDFLGRLKKYNNWQILKQLLESRYNVKGHHLCICGKNEKFRKCHPEVLQGVWKLKKDIKRFSIEL